VAAAAAAAQADEFAVGAAECPRRGSKPRRRRRRRHRRHGRMDSHGQTD